MSKALDTIRGKLSPERKLGIACAALMSRQCATCSQGVKVRLHREPNTQDESCLACIRATYSSLWHEECTCIK